MSGSLSSRDVEKLGIKLSCNRMDNGEYRFRLLDQGQNCGWSYILLKMPENISGWQNSHYHKGAVETCIIQKGWIGSAELLPDGNIKIIIHKEGEVFTIQPEPAHNSYTPAGAVVHVIKHGDCSLANDWFPSPELDLKTKHLSESDILQLAGK